MRNAPPVRVIPGPGLRIPHTLVLLWLLVVGATLLGALLPSGSFERVIEPGGRELVVAGTFRTVGTPATFSGWAMLTAIPRGLAEAHEIIFFCFVIGGTVAVARQTGTIEAVLGWALARVGHRPKVLIALGTSLFAIGSSTFGMAEEYIALVPLLVMLCAPLGLPRITAVGMVVVGAGIGYGTAAINPFTVIIAQDIAGLAPTSGAWFRVLLMIPMLALGVQHVWSGVRRIEPETDATDALTTSNTGLDAADSSARTLTSRHFAITMFSFLAVALLMWGIVARHWYLQEMMALFLGLAIVTALVGRLGVDEAAVAFCRGASELTTTALLIGFARAIKVVLDDAQVLDTIIHAVSVPLSSLGATSSALGMFAVQTLLNFVVPSGSGQAYVTMPIMAPLADLTGVSRQIAVLAFQFGDGFTNMLTPTNAVLVGILGLAELSFAQWIRYILPLMVRLWIAGALALVLALSIGYA